MRTASQRLAVVAILILGVLGSAMSASAQDVQVPVDTDSTVYTIDSDLRSALGLFPDISGFQGAELYRLEEGGYELVVRYRVNDRILRDRRSKTGAEVQQLRNDVSSRLAERREKRPLTQEGRYGLLAATTVHGLVEGGLIAGAGGLEGGNVATTVLSGGALGFFLPLLATQSTSVTEGEADMTFYGGLQGYAHGVQLATLATGGDSDGRAAAGVAAAFGAIEGTAGYLIARRRNWTGGHAEMVSYTGISGNLIGFGLGATLIREPDDLDGPAERRALAATSMLGSLGGIYLGHRMGRTDRYTEGDARIYFQSMTQGANLTASFLSIGGLPPARPTIGLASGSALACGVFGRWLVQDRDFTGIEGGLVSLGSIAGSLLGLAVTVQAETESTSAVAQSLGSAAGFGLTYGLLREGARRRASAATSGLDLDVNVGPTMARTPGLKPLEGAALDQLRPRLTISARF